MGDNFIKQEPQSPIYWPTSPRPSPTHSPCLPTKASHSESCVKARKEQEEKLKIQAVIIQEMQEELRKSRCEMETITNENKEMRKKNKMIEDWQHKSEEDLRLFFTERNKIIKECEEAVVAELKNPIKKKNKKNRKRKRDRKNAQRDLQIKCDRLEKKLRGIKNLVMTDPFFRK